MDIQLLTLCFVQGISEILPVSSSVNLYFFSHIFNIEHFSFSLKIALHAGSLIALLLFFHSELADIFRGIFSRSRRLSDTHFWPLFIGTIPVVIIGTLSRNYVAEFDSPKFMGIACVVFGILMYVFDVISNKKLRSDKKPISKSKSFIIGCFQAIAIFPGISRLGICITASRMLSIDRRKAVYVSLMFAIPSIAGSLCLELYKSFSSGNYAMLSRSSLICILITSIISLIAIKPCISFMEKHGFLMLTIYRILIGCAICFF